MTSARDSTSARPYATITFLPPGATAIELANEALPPASGSGRETLVIANGDVALKVKAKVTYAPELLPDACLYGQTQQKGQFGRPRAFRCTAS